jgi:hypothetical protein
MRQTSIYTHIEKIGSSGFALPAAALMNAQYRRIELFSVTRQLRPKVRGRLQRRVRCSEFEGRESAELASTTPVTRHRNRPFGFLPRTCPVKLWRRVAVAGDQWRDSRGARYRDQR